MEEGGKGRGIRFSTAFLLTHTGDRAPRREMHRAALCQWRCDSVRKVRTNHAGSSEGTPGRVGAALLDDVSLRGPNAARASCLHFGLCVHRWLARRLQLWIGQCRPEASSPAPAASSRISAILFCPYSECHLSIINHCSSIS
jgi:hypothetical protein